MNSKQIKSVRKDIKVISAVSKIASITKFIKTASIIAAVAFVSKDIIFMIKNR